MEGGRVCTRLAPGRVVDGSQCARAVHLHRTHSWRRDCEQVGQVERVVERYQLRCTLLHRPFPGTERTSAKVQDMRWRRRVPGSRPPKQLGDLPGLEVLRHRLEEGL